MATATTTEAKTCPLCHAPMVERPAGRTTDEQRWCGRWFDCPRCSCSVLIKSEALESSLRAASAPAPASDLARILTVPLPAERGRIRRDDRKSRSAAIRRLFKDMGLKGISVTTPSYSMASCTEIAIPRAAEHDRGRDHDYATCPHCREHVRAERRIAEIVVAAFPDMGDRSDPMTDYHDNPLLID